MSNHSSARSCCTTRSAMGYWIGVFALLYGGSMLARFLWPPARPYGDALTLAALGVACLLNFAKNRTLHCSIAGPVFVVGPSWPG